MSKEPHIFIRKAGKHFRVVCQRPYPNAVEEVLISQRFNTLEEAQSFVDAGLRAQSIYRSLTSAAAHARLLASRPKSIAESNCMNHTDPSFNGVVVALVIIIVIGGMIEFIGFFYPIARLR